MSPALFVAIALSATFIVPNVPGGPTAAALSATSENQPFVPLTQPGEVVPDFPLLDQDDRPFSLRRSAGSTVVSFVYTRCGDARMCPLVTSRFARIQTLLRGTDIRLVEVTLDPAYDRPPELHAYARAAGAVAPGWVFATGRPADVFALGARLGIASERTSANALAHTEAVAIVAGDGTLGRLIEGNAWSAQDVAAAARAEAALPADPLRTLALVLFSRASAACGIPGVGGVPLVGALAIFAACLALCAWGIKRFFPATP